MCARPHPANRKCNKPFHWIRSYVPPIRPFPNGTPVSEHQGHKRDTQSNNRNTGEAQNRFEDVRHLYTRLTFPTVGQERLCFTSAASAFNKHFGRKSFAAQINNARLCVPRSQQGGLLHRHATANCWPSSLETSAIAAFGGPSLPLFVRKGFHVLRVRPK